MLQALANAGIRRICYGGIYDDERSFDVARRMGIAMDHIPIDPESRSVAIPPVDG